MDLQQDIVVLFTRYPTPGLSKTRLIPVLGDEGAARLQVEMTQRVVSEIRHLASRRTCHLEIHYAGGAQAEMQTWLGADFNYIPQAQGHIGVKMEQAIAAHLGAKARIVLAGSDCPGITAHLLDKALSALVSHDLVIGPACDGGYYLIGVNGRLDREIVSALFTGISWGAETVFSETLARADSHYLTHYILPKFHDIDRPEDLRYLHNYPDAQ